MAVKMNKAMREKVIREVEKLLLDGQRYSQIKAYLAQTYNITATQSLNNYIHAVKAMWKETYDADLDSNSRTAIQRFEKIYQSAMQKGSYTIAMRALENMGKIQGIYTEKQEISHKGDTVALVQFVEATHDKEN